MTYWQALLMSIGFTVALTQGSMFRFLQKRGEPWNCSLCLGFYVGWIIGAWLIGELHWLEALALGPSTSMLAHLASSFGYACYRVGIEPLPESSANPPPAQSE